jgi:hypothetical protein
MVTFRLTYESESLALTRNDTDIELLVPQTVSPSADNRQTRVEIPYQEPKDNVILITGQEESVSIEGLASPGLFDRDDLAATAAYSDGWRGIAEWCQDMFSLVGSAGMLVDEVLDETLTCSIDTFEISLEYPVREVVSWSLSLTRGRAFYQPQAPRPVPEGDLNQSADLDGLDLTHPVTYTLEKSASLSATVVPDPEGDGADQNVLIENGKSRSAVLDFKPADVAAVDTLRNKWDVDAETFSFDSPFPGDSYEMQVAQVAPTAQVEKVPDTTLELTQ